VSVPRRHFIVPDTQVRPGVPLEHIDCAAQAIVQYKPDVVVVMGDWWDMHSLSTHAQPGSAEMEGARYTDDVRVGNEAFARLVGPMEAEQARLVRNKEKQWNPRKVFLFGNHEDRITRAIGREPRNAGAYSLDHLHTPGFERHDFLKRVWIDGIVYSHYFQNQNSSFAIGGSVDNRLNKIGESFVQGHQQGFLYGNRVYPTGKIRHGLVAGSFYLHDEGYKGPQGNDHWRGCVVLNRVVEGNYNIMPLDMDYLLEKYATRKAA
jgi:hypothetical protein